MPNSERPPESLEQNLRDLGSRIEYPPTPELARAVRRRLDAEVGGRAPARGPWRFPLSPRWAVPAAALVLVLFVALSPAVRGSLSDLFFSGQAASSGSGVGTEAGGSGAKGTGESAARSESGGSGGPSGPEESAAPPTAGSGAEDASAQEMPMSGASGSAAAAGSESAAAGAVGCPGPYLRVEPARAAPGTAFRLRGNLTARCERIRPAEGIRIDFRQGGKAWRLTSVDADRDLSFEARLRVPAGARPGRATVRATIRPGESAEKRFVVLR